MTGDGSRARRPGGRTRQVTERLSAAALDILAEKGVDGLQYEELAARAKVGRATVYRRWSNRDDLLRDVLARFAEASVPIADTGDVVHDLTTFLHAFAEASATPTGRAVLQILLRRVDEGGGLHRMGLELLDRRTDDLQRRLDRAAEAEQLPPVDAPFVNMMLAGPVQWFVLRRSRPFTLTDAREIVELVVAGLWRNHRD
ncbi:TetR/AcrR family transcriptional regulator [Micromonospora olivasterospora]|uniref:TetR family transcriptional regulator n=1 Tax=Micromonospora olivasterospora TaxID=1880 RepID=A0A562IBT9_MICOL|nr:TetR/AcrR family transcriptional regulator [Micromonospora olivasterospora]TWH68173.1 TetR family transcriptional regulator [Micromonospora olivasterospora]